MATPIVLRGRCACGAVTYTSTSKPDHLDFCYCTKCQQITGAPFGAWTGVPRASLTWSGDIATVQVLDFASRSFCSKCGGTLTIQYGCYPEKTHVAAGTVTEGALPEADCHLFVAEKPSWYKIPDDGVQRFEGFDEEFLDVFQKWREGKGD